MAKLVSPKLWLNTKISVLFKIYSNLQTLTYRPGSTSRLTVRLENKYNAISALKHANKLYEHKKILVITMMIRDSEE